VSDATRDLLGGALFVEPLPEVVRVVFISTPYLLAQLTGQRREPPGQIGDELAPREGVRRILGLHAGL
jgi:hypothetical protein